ncbi:MAG: phage virion morphogenesis protein [Betaproteobacteria bacterium]|nr:phage virion morphogenesis protein [Betaproteobacteria bacterium]
MTDANDLVRRIDALIAATAPAARRALAQQIAKRLRETNRARIQAQTAPDGTPYIPRIAQPQRGRKKGRLRQRMFVKLISARYLKAQATPAAAVVDFGVSAGRIARVHHFGLEDQVRPGIRHRYAARPLLGISPSDRAAIADLLLAHLANAGV